jgi:hypothetical protein
MLLQGLISHQSIPPAACNFMRNDVVVFRWFSGSDNDSTTLTVSTCNSDSQGDPVIQVLSSPNEAGGQWGCAG